MRVFRAPMHIEVKVLTDCVPKGRGHNTLSPITVTLSKCGAGLKSEGASFPSMRSFCRIRNMTQQFDCAGLSRFRLWSSYHSAFVCMGQSHTNNILPSWLPYNDILRVLEVPWDFDKVRRPRAVEDASVPIPHGLRAVCLRNHWPAWKFVHLPLHVKP
jgi:hypothetical protein